MVIVFYLFSLVRIWQRNGDDEISPVTCQSHRIMKNPQCSAVAWWVFGYRARRFDYRRRPLECPLCSHSTFTLLNTHTDTHTNTHTLANMCPCFHSFVSNHSDLISPSGGLQCVCANSCLPSSLALFVSHTHTHTQTHTHAHTHTTYTLPQSIADLLPTSRSFLCNYLTIFPCIVTTISVIHTYIHWETQICSRTHT